MRIEKICPVCGIKFSGRTNQIYCSVSCNQKARRRRNKHKYEKLHEDYKKLENDYNKLYKEREEIVRKHNNLVHELKIYYKKYGILKIKEKY